MPTIETEIWLALKGRISTLNIPGVPASRIAYPAATFYPENKAYIAVGMVKIAPQRIFVGSGAHERNGTLTLSYVAPLNQLVDVYDEQAGKIAEHFAADTKMRYGSACVRVVSAPHVVEGYRDEGFWRVPVNIRWQTFG